MLLPIDQIDQAIAELADPGEPERRGRARRVGTAFAVAMALHLLLLPWLPRWFDQAAVKNPRQGLKIQLTTAEPLPVPAEIPVAPVTPEPEPEPVPEPVQPTPDPEPVVPVVVSTPARSASESARPARKVAAPSGRDLMNSVAGSVREQAQPVSRPVDTGLAQGRALMEADAFALPGPDSASEVFDDVWRKTERAGFELQAPVNGRQEGIITLPDGRQICGERDLGPNSGKLDQLTDRKGFTWKPCGRQSTLNFKRRAGEFEEQP